MIKSKRFLSVFLAIIFTFSLIPNMAFAAESSTSIENLVKSAETKSNVLIKQMSSSNVKDIKVIDSTNLTSAINKAKASLKNFKGKQKTSLEKRVKVIEKTITHVKTYNATITNGAKLVNQLNTFSKEFKSTPFGTEKLFNDLTKQNEQFSNGLSKLINNHVRLAFSTKFQSSVKKELTSKKDFFTVNKKIDSFMGLLNSLTNTQVWAEFYSINEGIDDLDKDLQELLNNKWYNTYYPTLVSPEAAAIEKHIRDYFAAFNDRDAVAIAELYPFEDENEKKAMIELLNAIFSQLPDSYKVEITKVEVEFALKNDASAIVEAKEIDEGKETVDATTLYLTKVDGKWIIGNDSLEDE